MNSPSWNLGFVGGVWPVVQRELRQGARRPINFWLRVFGAAVGTILLYVISNNSGSDQAALGIRLFTDLHALLLALICAIVPAMAADCIAREKREGTLGLLFLTPLTPSGIVVGKCLVQALRAFTLWLAVLPVLVVPFVAGGVGWADVLSAVALEFCVAVFCLSAGILASAATKGRATAFVLALIIASSLVYVFGEGLGIAFVAQSIQSQGPWHRRVLPSVTEGLSMGRSLLIGSPAWDAFGFSNGQYAMVTRFNVTAYASSTGGIPVATMMSTLPGARIWRSVTAGSSSPSVMWTVNPGSVPGGSMLGWSRYLAGAPATRVWPLVCLESVIFAPLFCVLVLFAAAHCVKTSWKDRAPTLGQQALLKTFCTPLSILRETFARQMKRSLDRNPIAWLQQYSWKARLGKWGLCGVVVLLECFNSANWVSIHQIQFALVLVMGAVFTFLGVNSFLTEKRSGALELLLVTPLSVNRIITGRVWGLWKQLVPSAIVIVMCSLLLELDSARRTELLVDSVPIVAGFLTLPVFATYFALRVKNLIVAALLTWAALAVAWGFGGAIFYSIEQSFRFDPVGAALLIPPCDAALALVACFLLRHSLSQRIYSF